MSPNFFEVTAALWPARREEIRKERADKLRKARVILLNEYDWGPPRIEALAKEGGIKNVRNSTPERIAAAAKKAYLKGFGSQLRKKRG